MKIDCDTCTVRGDACTDCVVSFLTVAVRPDRDKPASGGPVQPLKIDTDQQRAVAAMAAGGLIPPLRHARGA